MDWLSKLFGFEFKDDNENSEITPENKENLKEDANSASQSITSKSAAIESYNTWKKQMGERPQKESLEVFVATNINEVKHCADSIKAGKTIIINYREIPLEEGQKFFTFMKGCIQVLGWECIRISTNIFLYTTDKIDIRKSISPMPDLSNTLQHSWDKPLDKM